MLREGTADLLECCTASFDGCGDVALYCGVGIDVYAQITHRMN